MRHEGYLGAIGAFLKGAKEEAGTCTCFKERHLCPNVLCKKGKYVKMAQYMIHC